MIKKVDVRTNGRDSLVEITGLVEGP